MAGTNGRTPEQVRRDIEAERDRLADAVDDLRSEMDVNAKLQAKLPLAAAAALGAGFVVSGGIGATMRLLMRRSRAGKTKARLGPCSRAVLPCRRRLSLAGAARRRARCSCPGASGWTSSSAPPGSSWPTTAWA